MLAGKEDILHNKQIFPPCEKTTNHLFLEMLAIQWEKKEGQTKNKTRNQGIIYRAKYSSGHN